MILTIRFESVFMITKNAAHAQCKPKIQIVRRYWDEEYFFFDERNQLVAV